LSRSLGTPKTRAAAALARHSRAQQQAHIRQGAFKVRRLFEDSFACPHDVKFRNFWRRFAALTGRSMSRLNISETNLRPIKRPAIDELTQQWIVVTYYQKNI
jgi:hypothetical protein